MLRPLILVALLVLGACADGPRVAGRQVATATCATSTGYAGPCYDGTDRTDRKIRDDITDRTVWCVEPAMVITAPSFMVFFDWDKSNLTDRAQVTIKQAAAAYKAKGGAQITATGHTDRSGSETYNMALSLRRANSVKDALVSEGVKASDISVVGVGEAQPLVPTPDGVREAQNRRVQIVLR